ncbi:hypothetical protein Tco_0434401 [Tanacetum coccineum]
MEKREPPLRVRSLVMTISLDLPKQILNAQTEARKPENIKNEDVGGMSMVPVMPNYGTGDHARVPQIKVLYTSGFRQDVPRYEEAILVAQYESRHRHLCTSLDMCTGLPFHNRQVKAKRTIQTLEDMLRACAIDFGKGWCRSPVCWTEVGEAQILGPELIQETIEKIIQIKQRMQSARDRQKSYVDLKHKLMEFQVGDKVMLKVSPWKGVVRFGKRGKLNLRYVGPFKVLEWSVGLLTSSSVPEELSRGFIILSMCPT